jgi:hypothetical protein
VTDRERIRRKRFEEWEQYKRAMKATEQRPVDFPSWVIDRLEQAERERDVAHEELRLREESQIPVIPRAAAKRIADLESRLADTETEKIERGTEIIRLRARLAAWGTDEHDMVDGPLGHPEAS